MINFGGHHVIEYFNNPKSYYSWYSMNHKEFIPTITASLLLSFSFASIVRYRPILLNKLMDSRLNFLFDIFVREADGFLLPAFRNLLYREELAIIRNQFF